MSHENVQIARRGVEAFKAGDWDTMASVWDPQILIRTDPQWPEQGVYGREMAIAWARGIRDAGGGDIQIEDAIDCGDRVLLVLDWAMRGERSGVESDTRYAQIVTIRSQRVVMLEMFLDPEQARSAVGSES